jgi:hypothetical protein
MEHGDQPMIQSIDAIAGLGDCRRRDQECGDDEAHRSMWPVHGFLT